MTSEEASTKAEANGDGAAEPSMAVTLQTTFLYQNRQTGQPSSAPLTARQLCRILCPTTGSTSNTSIITPETQLLGYDTTTHTYDSRGWQAASSVPLLKAACTSWYYENKGGEVEVKGPVSTRILADLLSNNMGASENGKDKIDTKTRVFPADNSGEWKHIQDLSNLQLAIEALTEVKSMPSTWPAADNDGDKETERDVAAMTYDDDGNGDNTAGISQQQVNDDLEAFLTSTDHLAPHASVAAGNADSDEEEYESDGGTRYVKDPRTGNWIHEALAPKKEKKRDDSTKSNAGSSAASSTNKESAAGTKKRKRSKPKFRSKNARNWVYVTGLPQDTNEEEVGKYFSKAGIIDLDPETQKPKVKIYRYKKGEEGGDGSNKAGTLKGDASVCYARPESVDLALQILDENLFRDGATLSVHRAKFEQHGTFDKDGNNTKGGRRMVSEAKRKVARLAALQAVGWDEGENGRIAGGLKGLRIVVLMNMFNPAELVNDKNDEHLQKLEKEVHSECEELGVVEKITVFSKHPAGVMIVKFTQPNAASDTVTKFNGMVRGNGRKVEASYWDGVTDYTCRDVEMEAKETEQRLDEFGDWLENQDLPDEFKLKVEE